MEGNVEGDAFLLRLYYDFKSIINLVREYIVISDEQDYCGCLSFL